MKVTGAGEGGGVLQEIHAVKGKVSFLPDRRRGEAYRSSSVSADFSFTASSASF